MTVRWGDGPDRQEAGFDPPDFAPAWPAEPEHLVATAPHLPRALHEAGRSAARDPDPGRYALGRVQVKGKAGEVLGTDGKQALVWGGFAFPFPDDLLVPAVPLFGSKELAGEAAVSVGLVKDWLSLVVGPWRVWLWVDREGRFPDVRGAIPRAVGNRVTFDDRDVAALLHALPDLRGTDSKPVTLDLGPTVTVRARDGESSPAADVPLPFSSTSGPPVRVVLGRDHLGRALALGLRELRVSSPERPVVFRDPDRVFLAATLDPALAVPPAGGRDVARPAAAVAPSPPIPTEPERRIPVPTRDDPPADRNGHADPPPTGDTVDPLAEAEGLRLALADAAARAARLVAALKQFRKERRALHTAWSSLRQLNLGP